MIIGLYIEDMSSLESFTLTCVSDILKYVKNIIAALNQENTFRFLLLIFLHRNGLEPRRSRLSVKEENSWRHEERERDRQTDRQSYEKGESSKEEKSRSR